MVRPAPRALRITAFIIVIQGRRLCLMAKECHAIVSALVGASSIAVLAESLQLQQIRGRGSPTSMSTIREAPSLVFITTLPGFCCLTSPIRAASLP